MGLCQLKAQQPQVPTIIQEESKPRRKHIFSNLDEIAKDVSATEHQPQLYYHEQYRLIKESIIHESQVQELKMSIINIRETEVFRVQQSRQSIKVTHLANCYWHSFIKQGQIPLDSIVNYKVQLNKSSYQDIIIGITTESIFGKTNLQSYKQCLAFRTYNKGLLYQTGKNIKCRRGAYEGQAVSIEVDTKDWRVAWKVGLQTIIETWLAPQMRGKNLYLAAMLYWQGDQIEIYKE